MHPSFIETRINRNIMEFKSSGGDCQALNAARINRNIMEFKCFRITDAYRRSRIELIET